MALAIAVVLTVDRGSPRWRSRARGRRAACPKSTAGPSRRRCSRRRRSRPSPRWTATSTSSAATRRPDSGQRGPDLRLPHQPLADGAAYPDADAPRDGRVGQRPALRDRRRVRRRRAPAARGLPRHRLRARPAGQRLELRAPMPTGRSGGGAAVVDGKIYVAGGRPPRGSDFAVYDPATDRWETLPQVPTQRNHLAVVGIGGKVYVAGGRFGGGFNSERTAALEIFDPATGAWSDRRAAAGPARRRGRRRGERLPVRDRRRRRTTPIRAASPTRTRRTIRAPTPGTRSRRCRRPRTASSARRSSTAGSTSRAAR